MAYHVGTAQDSKLHNQLIAKALERFHAELGNNDYGMSDVRSPEELLAQAKDLEPSRRNGQKRSGTQFRLESILSHISDFAAIAAISNGSSAQLTGVVWGSLKIILSLISQSADTMDDVLSMLDDISLALPRFRMYEETLAMTPGLESALVDAYTEMLCFCARAIKFLGSAPHRYLVRAGWTEFDGDFKHTLGRLGTLSQIVDREAESVRLRADRQRNAELEEALGTLKINDNQKINIPCYILPQTSATEFFGRKELLTLIGKALDESGHSGQKCILLHGIGGVGKTRLALEIATTHGRNYDVVAWIPADNKMKAQQGFHKVAVQLGLIEDDADVSQTSTAVTKVRSWLTSTDYRWLMVFDNVESVETLDYIWPQSYRGHVLFTSRDKSIAFGNQVKTHHIEPFEANLGVSALLNLTGRQNAPDQEKNSANELVEALGGLPLAINHIGGFIAQQNMTLTEFLPFYQKNAAKIDRRNLKRGEEDRTLSGVWEVALSQMPQAASSLLGLLAFLDPDGVSEHVLTDSAVCLEDGIFEFLGDDMEFIDAKEPLFRSALIERDAVNATLSMHRLIQTAVIRRLSEVEQTTLLDAAVAVLGHGFPNTWNTVTNHQFTSWAECECRVAHARALFRKVEAFKIRVKNRRALAELIFRFAWYLYERELYEDAEQFLEKGLSIHAESDTLSYAAATTLRGLVELDTKRLIAARESFLEGLRIREMLLNPDDALIASSLNALSLVFTELNQLEEAVRYGNRAIDIRMRTQSDRIGNSYSNMASTLLRMGEADAAEDMLGRCPSLTDFSDSTFLGSENPPFAGDMVLLSRIRQSQGRTDVALRLASKALTFRQKTHGNRLKTCDSLQLVAELLHKNGDESAAIYYLKESASIAQKLPYSKGYVARANYRLACLFAGLGEKRQSEVHLQAANTALNEISTASGGLADNPNEEDKFNNLVPWMLW